MVLLAELLLAVGILAAVVALAVGRGDVMSDAEPDRSPGDADDGPLTADDLVAMRIPLGVGYRKVDVDRLLDRVARQLPISAVAEHDDLPDDAERTPPQGVPPADAADGAASLDDRVSLAKDADG